MVKLLVTERMRSLLPASQSLKVLSEIDYKALKSAAQAAQVPLSALLLGSEFCFPQIQTVAEGPEPAFLQAIKQKRLIREYGKMTNNVAGHAEKTDNAEMMQNVSFSVTMISLVFLAFLVGYFGAELLGFNEYMVIHTQKLVLGLISLVAMLYLEVFLHILKSEKATWVKKQA